MVIRDFLPTLPARFRSLVEGVAYCFNDALCRNRTGYRRKRSLRKRCFGTARPYLFQTAKADVVGRVPISVRREHTNRTGVFTDLYWLVCQDTARHTLLRRPRWFGRHEVRSFAFALVFRARKGTFPTLNRQDCGSCP